MRPALLSWLALLPTACSSVDKAPRESELHWLCSFSSGRVQDELAPVLAAHGIIVREGGSSLGSSNIHLEGTLDDLLRARECLTAHEHGRVLRLAWPADVVILPGDPRWGNFRSEIPSSFRVASVAFGLTPTRCVLDFLIEVGLRPHVFLGATTDLVFVPRENAERAWSILRSHPLRGMRVCHPDFERLPPEFDGLVPLSSDDPESARAIEVYRRFPEPKWGLHLVERVAKATRNRPLLTPEEREFIENIEPWLRARAFSTTRR